MELSERDLLLLDEFMYTDIAPGKKGKTVESIIRPYTDSSGRVSVEKVQSAIKSGELNVSGDLTKDPEVVRDVLQRVYSNDNLKTLKIADTTEEVEGGIRGACFVDKDGDATVAFRGTGGSYQQWSNNFEGYGDVSQQSQRDAAAFINRQKYNNITVTGHSNGGNQAMYSTVVCGDKIDRCVSFEGQGGSREFMNKYSAEIARNKGKITNYCADRDFVSPLLYDFAGTTKFVRSDSRILKGFLAHGGYGILTASDGKWFDDNGNFTDGAFVPQQIHTWAIHEVTKLLAECSDIPVVGPILELVTDVTGGIVGMIISEKWNMLNLFDERVRNKWKKALGDAYNSLKDCANGVLKDAKDLIHKGADALLNIGNSVYEKFKSLFGGGGNTTGGGGGKSGGSGGRADRISVSPEEMSACINRYMSEKSRLTEALNVCNNAAQMLARSWAGPSFAEMSVRLASTYKNLFQSLNRIDDAIGELRKTISIMENAEKKTSSAAAALDIGVSPFA